MKRHPRKKRFTDEILDKQVRGGNFAGCMDALRNGRDPKQVVLIMMRAIEETPHIKKQIEELGGVKKFINQILRKPPGSPQKTPKTTQKNK